LAHFIVPCSLLSLWLYRDWEFRGMGTQGGDRIDGLGRRKVIPHTNSTRVLERI
tara:strand:- start:157 stop:318 length:162 start_codon:yes stop_codon:yes gene_type:complete